jgi:hypothetical protein
MPSAPQGVEYVAPLLALITIAISIPLVLCKVPPNVIYGVRTRKTLSDPRSGMKQTTAAGWRSSLLAWLRWCAGQSY